MASSGCDGDSADEGLELPPDTNLPLFVYGNLKPGELGYDVISEHVDLTAKAQLDGSAWVRDGVPLIQLEPGSVHGHVVRFKSPAGYGRVCKFEPARYYKWEQAICTDPAELEVNVLVARGLSPDEGGADALHEPWSTAQDPLFKYGLSTIAATLLADGLEKFKNLGPYDGADWQRFYRLQAAYMLASSILERIAFRTAPNECPTAAVKKLGQNPSFVKAVQMVGFTNSSRPVYRSDYPRRKVPLRDAADFAVWAYQIRSNLMHRGKSAYAEAELVRTALIDLHDVLRVYLIEKVPAFRKTWAQAEPEREPSGWRIKPLPPAPPSTPP